MNSLLSKLSQTSFQASLPAKSSCLNIKHVDPTVARIAKPLLSV